MENNSPKESEIRLTAIIIGWVVSEFVSFILGFIAGISIGNYETITSLLYFVIGPIGTLVGGYIAGDMSKDKEKNHGIIVSFVSIFLQ